MVSSTLKANTRCKRSVSFKGTVLVHGVLHLKNYTEEEIRACWFDREDMENIKRRAYSILKKLQKQREEEGDSSMFDMSSLDEDFCLTGLEGQMKTELAQKQQRRFEAINMVLETQEKQFILYGRIADAKAIADAYSKVAATSKRIARGWGIVYEHELGFSLKTDK
jgi:hypothetical protein